MLNDNRVRVEAREADARRIAAEARQAQAAAVRERREQLTTLRTQLDTGAGTSADWFALANGFSEIGDTSAAEAARARGNEVKASDTYRGATIGQVGNLDHENVSIGKAGRSRWLGRKPHVRGVAMNPVDHPLGGGEGKTSGGRHPVSPWGQPTKGFKTRRRKDTSRFIVQRRPK